MRLACRRAALLVSALVLGSCSDITTLDPVRLAATAPALSVSALALPAVRISEFHYDNGGTDAGEAIEVSFPAGTSLTGWNIVLYNGAGGAVYDTDGLGALTQTACGTRGVVVLTYPVNGIQNGSPDGIALVDAGGTVVEFLSYEGSFAGVGGAANGLVSTDIGVAEVGTEALGMSLQRSGTGAWSAPAANTFGACNDQDIPPAEVASVTVTPASATVFVGGTQSFSAAAFDAAAQPVPGTTFSWSSTDPAIATVSAAGVATGVGAGDAEIIAAAPNGIADTAQLHVDALPPPPSGPTFISEFHYDNNGTDAGEAIEIEAPAGADLAGWSIVLYDGTGATAYNTRALSGIVPDLCSGRGVITFTYPSNGIQNGSPDGIALVDAASQVVEFLSYEGTFTASGGPAGGSLSTDIGPGETSTTTIGFSLKRYTDGNWYPPSANSFGACNGAPPPPPASTILFTGRTPGDVPLPVGFQDQLFGTLHDGNGAVVPTTFTWTSETPAIATIDQDGVFTAMAAGTAVFRATASDLDHTTATWSLPTQVAVASATAQYAGNAEFGEPADGDPSDDFIIRHDQYTVSFNKNRGTPNWVSYDLEASHFGLEDRCDCFTFDPALPAGFTPYTTADYTGAGTFHGYGIDRGHLARSFDRTSASLDNAYTFYFSNIVPQAADLNQGPWAIMENYLGDLARLQNKEVYIIAGVAGNKGTIKNQGKIVIPVSTWKVAVILPRDHGLADVHSLQDLDVVAVIMPNDPGVRNINWETYKTTIDAVEAASGYDLLALLRDDFEIAVESNTLPPVAATDGPYTGLEGSSVALSGAGSSDPDGDALTYAWSFGDGGTAVGVSPSHTYAQDGSYNVRLIVTDIRGLADTAFSTATIGNVAPSIAAFAGAILLPGETYTASGSFSDPGADSWTATVDYGDGSGVATLGLTGKNFSLSHTYETAGTFTVAVRVSDDDATSSRTGSVTVLTPLVAVQNAMALVDQLVADGKLSAGNGNSLSSKLDGARKQLEAGKPAAALEKLQGLLTALDDLVVNGKISAADAQPLRILVTRIIASIS